MPESSYGSPFFEGDTPGAFQESGSGGPGGAVDWADITGKPATATRDPAFAEVTARPVTLAGYGITDAVTAAEFAAHSHQFSAITGELPVSRLSGGATGDVLLGLTGSAPAFGKVADSHLDSAFSATLPRTNVANVFTEPQTIKTGLATDTQALLNANGLELRRYFSSNTGPTLIQAKARGTEAVPTAVIANDILGGVNYRGHNGTGFQTAASLRAFANETHTTSARGARLSIAATPIGTTTLREVFVVHGEGHVHMLNVTAAPGTPSGGYDLYADAGALKGKGTSGTVTTIGTADPHCPDCGRDAALEWESSEWGYVAVCVGCLVEQVAGLMGGTLRGLIGMQNRPRDSFPRPRSPWHGGFV